MLFRSDNPQFGVDFRIRSILMFRSPGLASCSGQRSPAGVGPVAVKKPSWRTGAPGRDTKAERGMILDTSMVDNPHFGVDFRIRSILMFRSTGLASSAGRRVGAEFGSRWSPKHSRKKGAPGRGTAGQRGKILDTSLVANPHFGVDVPIRSIAMVRRTGRA